MVSRSLRARHERGFTLVELLFALGILVFGVTSLIGVLGVGVGTRRTAEQRARAALCAEHVLLRIQNELVAQAPPPDGPDLTITGVEDQPAEELPGLQYSVRFAVDQENPELVLATVIVTWLQQGQGVQQTFHRILPRQIPFAQRVAQQRRQK